MLCEQIKIQDAMLEESQGFNVDEEGVSHRGMVLQLERDSGRRGNQCGEGGCGQQEEN